MVAVIGGRFKFTSESKRSKVLLCWTESGVLTQRMKCQKCGSKFQLTVGGMGQSQEPGHYFYCGIAFLVGALLLLVLQFFAWAALCVLFAAIVIRYSFDARDDVMSSSCPHCQHTNPIYPWSM